MSAAVAAELEFGLQPPRVRCAPSSRLRSRGLEAVELARSCGLELDVWQQQVLVDACRVTRAGRWAAFQVGVNVARQNGKGGITEARELAALFAFGEPLVIHSAHLFDTSLEAFRRLLGLIEEGGLQGQVRKVSYSHGEEGIELHSRQRIRYRTRSKGGGRGLTSGLLVFDEAMFLALAAHGALIPTLSTVATAQVWYAGSAVDQHVHEHGLVFTQIRNRALEGGDRAKRLAYFEWSVGDENGEDYESPASVPGELLDDRGAWAQANPALGIRLADDAIAAELDALDARSFCVERLGVGDYPLLDEHGSGSPVDAEAWDALRDLDSVLLDPVVLAFDVSPDRRTSVVAAGRRADGLLHSELVEERPGTGWVPGRLRELVDAHDVRAIMCDGYGPAASVVRACEDSGVRVEALNATDHAEACGAFVDIVDEQAVRHRGELAVRDALRAARAKLLGDRWAWSRKSSTANISPLVATTLALAHARRIPAGGGEVNIW